MGKMGSWCQGGESNSRPRAYESPALPLSYPGNPCATHENRPSQGVKNARDAIAWASPFCGHPSSPSASRGNPCPRNRRGSPHGRTASRHAVTDLDATSRRPQPQSARGSREGSRTGGADFTSIAPGSLRSATMRAGRVSPRLGTEVPASSGRLAFHERDAKKEPASRCLAFDQQSLNHPKQGIATWASIARCWLASRLLAAVSTRQSACRHDCTRPARPGRQDGLSGPEEQSA